MKEQLHVHFYVTKLSRIGNQRRRSGRGAQVVGPGWRAFCGDAPNARYRKHGLRSISSIVNTVSI